MKTRRILRILKRVRLYVTLAVCLAVAGLLLSSGFGPGISRLGDWALDSLKVRIRRVISPGPVIVERLQSLNRLETARQVCSDVIEAKAESLPLPEFLVKDKLLMRVQTELVAGIDLAGFSPDDVEMKKKTVVVHLPRPRIFSVRIDDEHSSVYSRERGWLVFNPDRDLERQARLKALAYAEQAALNSGLLAVAQANGEKNLRSILQSLGFHQVEFLWDDSHHEPIGLTEGPKTASIAVEPSAV